MYDRQIAITGCGRSGTLYITRVLRQLGLNIGHETARTNDPKPAGNVSWYLAPIVDPTKYFVIHQVRHPVRVIASLWTLGNPSWEYIYKHAPSISPDSPRLLQGMQYWVEWNKMAEAKASVRFRIEDLSMDLEKLCELLGLLPNYGALSKVPNDTNTRRHHAGYRKVTWLDLQAQDEALCTEIMQMAERYGYDY